MFMLQRALNKDMRMQMLAILCGDGGGGGIGEEKEPLIFA